MEESTHGKPNPEGNGKDLNGSVVFYSSMGGRAYCLSLGPRMAGAGEGGGFCPRAKFVHSLIGVVGGEEDIKKNHVETCVTQTFNMGFVLCFVIISPLPRSTSPHHF